MSGSNRIRLMLIWIVVSSVSAQAADLSDHAADLSDHDSDLSDRDSELSDHAADLSDIYKSIEKELQTITAQEFSDEYKATLPVKQAHSLTAYIPSAASPTADSGSALRDSHVETSIPAQRNSYSFTVNDTELTSAEQILLPNGSSTAPTASEAQMVWSASQQALIDQLSEQIRDNEAALRDVDAASTGVQRCLHSAIAAKLEATQQAKLITLLSKNSVVLIEHMDRVEMVAGQDLETTGGHLAKFREQLQDLRSRSSKAEQDLVQIHQCGQLKPLTRLRRQAELATVYRARQYRLRRFVEPVVQARHSLNADEDMARVMRTRAAQLAKTEKLGKRNTEPEMASEAQGMWAEAQQVLVDQLSEQIKDNEASVDDQSAAVDSVKMCVQSAAAAGLEGRQQAKIIGLLTKNSKDFMDHMDDVERASNEDILSTDERLIKYKLKLENLRSRMTMAQKDWVAIHECGRIKPLGRLRRRRQLLNSGRVCEKVRKRRRV